MSCQSGVWAKQATGGSTIGRYKFQISGYVVWQLGVGVYDSSTGKFSGTLICDPQTYSAFPVNCGTDGHLWCGSDTVCAWHGANNDAMSHYGKFYHVEATNLSITSVTKQW